MGNISIGGSGSVKASLSEDRKRSNIANCFALRCEVEWYM